MAVAGFALVLGMGWGCSELCVCVVLFFLFVFRSTSKAWSLSLRSPSCWSVELGRSISAGSTSPVSPAWEWGRGGTGGSCLTPQGFSGSGVVSLSQWKMTTGTKPTRKSCRRKMQMMRTMPEQRRMGNSRSSGRISASWECCWWMAGPWQRPFCARSCGCLAPTRLGPCPGVQTASALHPCLLSLPTLLITCCQKCSPLPTTPPTRLGSPPAPRAALGAALTPSSLPGALL